MANRPTRYQPGSRYDFPWYTIPRNVGPEIYTRWNAKLDWLKQRKVHVLAMELVIEFLARVSFARKDGIYADNNLTFCLGDERHALSLADFALRMEIYLPSEVHSESCQQYIAVYDKGTAQESDIFSSVHRLLHRLITKTINQQQERDTCPTIDVFFLWALTSDNTHVDLPFLLVDFLAIQAEKDRRESPVYGDDTPRGRVPRWVRQMGNEPKGEEPPVFPTNDEMPMNPYCYEEV
ncbi:unnamed protein product [Lactuca saligna]|uniref:Uncharacterized protein n=1 Tax=Lactuca saligna TaxID=75948 RepID=A0AA36A0Q2_LACSI|nr:unnamed protein product [Lactuca saligna]